MKKRIGFLMGLLMGLSLLIASAGFAEQGAFGLAAKGGTLGLGLESTMGVTDNINARLGLNYFIYNYTGTESGVSYEFDLTLMSIPLLFDWHPNGSGFRLSAGAMFNGNKFEGTARPTSGNFDIDDGSYTTAQLTKLESEITFNAFSPYLGIGYGNAIGKARRWNFVLDLGIIYQGSPEVEFTATGPIASDAAFRSDLAAEKAQLESALESFQWYPVIMLGVSYKF
ncbi:MAG: hypothetical protein K8S18_16720 [Desulfobacula sp.]|nr:hypothetical protein [Desulfobacula sp.]